MSSIWRVVRVIRWMWPTGARRGAGQGDVDPVARRAATPARSASSAAARSSSSASSSLRALLAPAPTGPRSSAGSSAIPRRIVGQLGLAAEVADPQLLQLGGAGARPSIAAAASASISSIRSSIRHRRASGMASDDIRSQRDRSRGGDVQRLGAAARSGIVTCRLAGRRAPRPAAPRARRRGRASRHRSRAVEAPRRRGRPARPAAPACSPTPARASGWAKIEPMLARTAFGENGSAQPGPSTTVPSSRACGGADDRADVAGIGDAVQVDAGRAARARPSAAARPRSPGCPSRAPRPRPAARARPPRRPGRCRRRSSTKRGSAPARQPGLDQVLALGRRTAPSRSRCLRVAQLADQLQLLVLGARDHRSCVFYLRFFSWNEKARP